MLMLMKKERLAPFLARSEWNETYVSTNVVVNHFVHSKQVCLFELAHLVRLLEAHEVRLVHAKLLLKLIICTVLPSCTTKANADEVSQKLNEQNVEETAW